MRSFLILIVVITWTYLGFYAGKYLGIAEGRSTALKEALKTNPPSEELEMTCLGLWLGEQNKKYFEKENRRAR